MGTRAGGDPEFDSYTYGDPNRLKAKFRNLKFGDIVVFYALLDFLSSIRAGMAKDFSPQALIIPKAPVFLVV